jgi:hypothetical protein
VFSPLAIEVGKEESVAGIESVPSFGTIAITVIDQTVHCKREAKNSGLETIPDVALAFSQIKGFRGLAD